MRFLLSKLRIFLFFPIPYLSQPLQFKSEKNTFDDAYPLFFIENGKDAALKNIFLDLTF